MATRLEQLAQDSRKSAVEGATKLLGTLQALRPWGKPLRLCCKAMTLG